MKHFVEEYLAIIIGLGLGSVAHFGRLLSEGKMPTFLQSIGFLMQLGVVGLAAAVVTKQLGIVDPDPRALATAILAISTQEVIQFLKKRSWRPLIDALFQIFKN